jgi:S1-C subfamily serine protease
MHYASRHVFGVAVLSALMAGAVSGGVVGFLTPYYLASRVSPVGQVSYRDQAQGTEEQSVVSLVKQTSPAVVAINITKEVNTRATRRPSVFDDPFFAPFFGETPSTTTSTTQSAPKKERIRVGGGSGFFVSKEGLVVTNRHVVEDPQAEYTIVLQDGKTLPAKVLAVDTVLDLGILKVEGTDFPALSLGESDKVEVGQTVVAIGNALAEFKNTVTKGVVSGVNRRLVAGAGDGSELIEEAIQTDAAINPGNSGGPLLDLSGKVIGVNTAVSQNGQSLGFAIPINAVKRAVESVQKSGRIIRPWLGVRYVMIDEEMAKRETLPSSFGALILRGQTLKDLAVTPGSPADKAGLQENDIILEIQGQKLSDERSLASALANYAPGDEIELKIVHKGKETRVKLKLEERKTDS